jgi:aryl-alcohol dehydrogenase-like predicted oxidoreductase
MQYRQLGSTSLQVSEIGFGCARIGGVFEGSTRDDLVALLRTAFDAGITFFDTADMYTQGESEKLLGAAFARNRSHVVIASKAGYCLPSQKKAVAKIKPLLRPLIRRMGINRERIPGVLKGSLTQNFSPQYLTRCVEGSLGRLRTDYLDLFQLHSPPAEVLHSGDFLEPLAKLKRDGKIRYFGVSCETTEDARICLQYPEISSLQIRVSLLEQSACRHVLPCAVQQGIGIIARECFAGGMLAKPLADVPAEEITPDRLGQRGIVTYHAVADSLAVPLPQVSLHFVRQLTGVSVTLLGMRTREHLAENLGLLAAGQLSESQSAMLCEAAGYPRDSLPNNTVRCS